MGMGTKLTAAEQKFYDRIRLRAVSATYGAPYLMPAIFKLAPVAVNDGSLWAMAVDTRGRVYINFDFVSTREVDWAAGALIHEVWHVLRRHATRAKHHNVDDYTHWNTAGDLEINAALPERNTKVMTDIKYPANFGVPDDKVAEWYYDNIGADQQPKQSGGDSGDGKGEEGQGQSGDGEGQDQGKGQEANGRGGRGKGAGKNGKGDCGSAAGGGKADYEVENNDNGDFPSMSETDIEYTRKEVAKRIRKQVEKDKANGIGKLPGSMQEWAEAELAPPRVRWQDVFRGKIWSEAKYRTGRQVINRRRVRRRSANGDILYPAMRDTQLTAAAALDDSGSNLGNIPGALSEIFNMLRTAGVKELKFFTVDTKPGPIQTLRRPSDPILLSGGGGTDMRIGFKQLSDMAPDIGILFTDSQTPWPSELPDNGKTRFIIGALIGSDYDEKAYDEIPDYLKDITVRIDLRD